MAGLTAEFVGERLAEIRTRVENAGGDGYLAIVAVTKDFGLDAVHAALDNGLHEFGENRADQLIAKAEAVQTGAVWHYLARVQRNQVRKIAAHVDLWQAVDRVTAGQEIAKRAPDADILVQVNVSGEPQKHGAKPQDVPGLVVHLSTLGLDVRGLMAVGPTGPPEAARPGFRELRKLATRLALPVCSMGMTDDLEVAVQEGSTMLRIGRGLFGERASTT